MAKMTSIRCFKEHAVRAAFFEIVERRFARQARLTTLIAGASGFYMVQRLDLWDRFGSQGSRTLIRINVPSCGAAPQTRRSFATELLGVRR